MSPLSFVQALLVRDSIGAPRNRLQVILRHLLLTASAADSLERFEAFGCLKASCQPKTKPTYWMGGPQVSTPASGLGLSPGLDTVRKEPDVSEARTRTPVLESCSSGLGLGCVHAIAVLL